MLEGQEGFKEVPKTTARHVRQTELNTRCHPNINKVLLAPCSRHREPYIRQTFFFPFPPCYIVKNKTNLMQSLAGNKYVPLLGAPGCESDGQ